MSMEEIPKVLSFALRPIVNSDNITGSPIKNIKPKYIKTNAPPPLSPAT